MTRFLFFLHESLLVRNSANISEESAHCGGYCDAKFIEYHETS